MIVDEKTIPQKIGVSILVSDIFESRMFQELLNNATDSGVECSKSCGTSLESNVLGVVEEPGVRCSSSSWKLQ
jgi:hypothetical protein